MLHTTLVSTSEDLEQIHLLNTANLKQNISEEEKDKEGFVSWLYPLDLLQKMHALAPSVIVKEDNIVVGYALTTLKQASAFHSDLREMLRNLFSLKINNQPVINLSFYLMGQVCINKNYRGKGVFKMLYEGHKQFYKDKYDYLVTEISTSNIRSQKAHEKIGFKTIHTYKDAMDEWNVVVWDWS